MKKKENGTKFTIDRKIFNSDIWFSSPWKLKIWFYLIGHANYKDNNFMGMKIKRGQLIRSYRTIANDCSYKIGYRKKKPSLSTVRRICEELTKELRIERRTVQGMSLFSIVNYNKLQPLKTRKEQRKESLENSRRTVGEQDKNDIRMNKNDKNKYADFVLMTKEEYQKLIKEYGKEYTKKFIDKLNAFKGSKGKTYKSDYLAILNWVIDAVLKDKDRIAIQETKERERQHAIGKRKEREASSNMPNWFKKKYKDKQVLKDVKKH